MALVRYDPWRNLTDLQNEMNRLFANRLQEPDEANSVLAGEWIPPVDVREDSEQYVIDADVPGVDPNNVDVSLEGDTLTVRGERSQEREVGEASAGLKRSERIYGTFIRTFHLPESADADQVKARYNHGVLQITIPKADRAKAKKIKVQH